MVGRRGEAPLVPPYWLRIFKLDGAVPVDTAASWAIREWSRLELLPQILKRV